MYMSSEALDDLELMETSLLRDESVLIRTEICSSIGIIINGSIVSMEFDSKGNLIGSNHPIQCECCGDFFTPGKDGSTKCSNCI
jgi:hypothetical protein